MDDRTNTIFGWVLFAGIIVMGLRFISGLVYHDTAEHHEGEERVLGYAPDGVVEDGGTAAAEMSVAEALTLVSAADGEKVYAKCASCHTVNSGGADGIGPNLYGVMGLPVGKHASGYAYSEALSGHGGNWDWETMNAWLKKPAAFASGTKMSFAGLSKAEDRAAVMLYMNEQGSNIALPVFTPPAEGEAAEGEAAEGEVADGEAPAEDGATEEAVEAPAEEAVPAE